MPQIPLLARIKTSPPTVPARSPLRPTPRSTISSDEFSAEFSVLSLTTSDGEDTEESPVEDDSVGRALGSPSDTLDESRPDKLEASDELEPPPASAMPTPLPVMTKRHHALHELLASERAYASDLALIRDVHIPLALGLPLSFSLPSRPTPAKDSASSSGSGSSRVHSFASNELVPSGITFTEDAESHPMSPLSAKIIFSNIPALALFSDSFSIKLEEGLGDVLVGGQGDDHVGQVFLENIPLLSPPYTQYITHHSLALAHLASLTANPTPALKAYLEKTRAIAAELSHAWDIQSLLIKPVQRVLKYSLLLQVILDETPKTHSDYSTLARARIEMEQVARNINEDKRRWEVVREVLAGKDLGPALPPNPSSPDKKESKSEKKRTNSAPISVPTSNKPSLGVTTSASVNLTKMKSMSLRALAATESPLSEEMNEEAILVARLEARLHAADSFMLELAKGAIEWCHAMHVAMSALGDWAASFGRVLNLEVPLLPESTSWSSGSEAFDAFTTVLAALHHLSSGHGLETALSRRLLVPLGRLRQSRNEPLVVLSAMHDAQPAHEHLLTASFTAKNRPPPALLARSTYYLALRGQLAVELGVYLQKLEKGLAACVRELAAIQAGWWDEIRLRWAELWDALRVEGERMDGGAVETTAVWRSRWEDVARDISSLAIVSPPKKFIADKKAQAQWYQQQMVSQQKLHLQQYQEGPPKLPALSGIDTKMQVTRRQSQSSNKSSSNTSSASKVSSMLASLDPGHRVPTSPVLSGSASMRPRGSSEASLLYEEEDRGLFRKNSKTKSKSIERERERLKKKGDNTIRNSTGSSEQPPMYSPEMGIYEQPERKSRRSDTHQHGRSHSRTAHPHTPSTISYSNMPAKYLCAAIHPCNPPPNTPPYHNLRFLSLAVGAVVGVLGEAGHPSIHDGLPLRVDGDQGEDCLLIVRELNSGSDDSEKSGTVGWALASFLVVLD